MAMNGGRFVLFDQTGDRGRIMLDPNVYYEVPNVGAGLEAAGEFHHVYRDAMASAFTALQTMRDSRPYSITLCGLRDGLEPAGSGDSDTASLSWAGSTDEMLTAAALDDKEYEEDAADIEALLYSEEDDEEFSTGHSPSDLTSQEDDKDHFESQEEISSVLRNVEDTGNSSSQVDAVARSVKKPAFNNRKQFTAGRLSLKKRRARKEKIRQTVRVLQSLVPGGRCLDPAVILDQAIHYMKSLQMKVLELEAGRQATK